MVLAHLCYNGNGHRSGNVVIGDNLASGGRRLEALLTGMVHTLPVHTVGGWNAQTNRTAVPDNGIAILHFGQEE